MKFVIIIITTLFLISGCGDLNQELNKENKEEITTEIQVSWEERLYTPTHFTKIDDYYFIVDCWQHRVIYSDDLSRNIGDWNVLDDAIGAPHSIATDGQLIVVDNTGYNTVNVYSKDENGGFSLIQKIEDVGNRPHRTIYDSSINGFYVLTAEDQQIHFFKNVSGKLELVFTKHLEFLGTSYTRSIRIIDDKMYFVSGPGKITEVNYLDNSFAVLNQYDVPEILFGMNDLIKIGDYFYISATPQLLVRVSNLKDLENGNYENIYNQFPFKGTPYYFEIIDDYLYIPEITEYSSIVRMRIEENDLIDFERLHDYGLPNDSSIERKEMFPR